MSAGSGKESITRAMQAVTERDRKARAMRGLIAEETVSADVDEPTAMSRR
jgi:hypothetical protein